MANLAGKLWRRWGEEPAVAPSSMSVTDRRGEMERAREEEASPGKVFFISKVGGGTGKGLSVQDRNLSALSPSPAMKEGGGSRKTSSSTGSSSEQRKLQVNKRRDGNFLMVKIKF